MRDKWHLHWLEAAGDLNEYKPLIVREFQAAYGALSAFLSPPRLDILLQKTPGQVIPEIGLAGRAYSETLFSMAFDPDNVNLSRTCADGTLQRQILHEVHHCLRMAGAGYGWSLGEALVSEGLAGQFVSRLLGTAPECWEQAIDRARLRETPVRLQALNSPSYDHSAWFFGSGELPRWYGYTLGYEMVAAWLRDAGDIDAEKWINVPAKEVFVAARKDGLLQI
ncbi:hypothetical protein HA44_04805 [Mixta gaviniae]|nr:hypothetical protein HA44_04805 [Mixta gaviniae]